MFSVWQRPQIVWGGGDEGGSGGGSDKTYNSLSEAARDGQHGNAVNIKGKGRQKVEFADKSYDKKMSTASSKASTGGSLGGYTSLADMFDGGGPGYSGAVSGSGGGARADTNKDGYISAAEARANPLDQNIFSAVGNYVRGGGMVGAAVRALSGDGGSSAPRPPRQRIGTKGMTSAQRKALTDAGYEVTKGGSVKKDGGTVAGLNFSGSQRVNDIMNSGSLSGEASSFGDAFAAARKKAGGDGGTFTYGGKQFTTNIDRAPKTSLRPQLRPTTVSPAAAPIVDYDSLYGGTSFGSFGNPVDMSRDVPLPDQRRPDMLDVQPSAPSRPSYAGDPYAGDRVPSLPPEVSGGGGVSDDDVYRRAPSASEYLQEQRLLDSFPDGGQDTFIDDETYETAAFGDTGFGKFLNENILGPNAQLETTSGGGVASLPVRVGRQDGPGTIANAVPGAVTEADAKAYAQGFGAIDPDTGLRPRINKTSNIVPGETDLLKKNVATMARLGSGALDFAAQPFGQGAQDFSQSMMDKAKAFDENITSRLPQETQDKLNAELSWDNVGTQVAANAGPVAASVGAATFGLVPAIAAGVTLGIGGLVNQVNDTVDAEFKSGNLQNTEAFKALVEGGLDPETAKQTMASQLANQAAPYVAAVAGAGGVVTNKVLNIAGAPKLLNNFLGKKIATPLGQRAARATTAGVLEAGAEGFQEFAEGKLPGMVTGYDPLRTTAAQDRQNFLLGSILGGGTATALTAAGQQGPTVQRAADIDAVGTSPYTAIAAPETTVPVAQIAPPPQAAAADVISGKPIITPAPEPVGQIEVIPGQNAVSSLATPPPVVPGIAIAPEVLALSPPTGQVPSVRSPVEFANLQNQRGFDPSQVDTAASQAAAITPDDIGTDMLDDGASADAAAREQLASELLQRGTIPNPNALADQLAAQAARNEATADGLETADIEAAVQDTLPGLDIDDGSNRQSIGAARVDDTTRLADENAQLAEILQRGETEAAALDDGLALDSLDLSGKMFTGGVPTNFETTGLSRFSPLADQIYTTSQRADMQRANQLQMALRARRLAEEAAQKPQNIAQAALDALDQGGPDKSAVEQVNEAREATKLYREYIDTKNQTEALNRAMRSGIGSVFNPDGSVQPTIPSPAAEVTAPEAVSTSGIVPPVDAAAVADQIVGSSEAGLDAGLSEDAAMAEIMRNFDTDLPLTETVEQRVARQLESQRRRQEGQIPDRNFITDLPLPGTDTPAQQIARQLENQRRRQEGQIPDRNFLTDIPRPGTDTPAQQIARQLENQRRRQQSQLDGIGSLATVPPKEAPLEGEVLSDLGPFVGGRGEFSPTGETIEGEVVEGTINRPTPTVEDLAQGIGSLTAAEDAAKARITPPTADVESKIEQDRKKARNAALRSLSGQTIDTESVMPPAGGTPYFPELPTDDVLPPEEREGGPSGPSDDRPAVVPVDMTNENNDAQGCPPGYRRVLNPPTGQYICLKIEEGSAGGSSDPAEETEEEDVVIDIPITERPKISPYYVPEMIESNYTPYVPGRRARIFKDVAVRDLAVE